MELLKNLNEMANSPVRTLAKMKDKLAKRDVDTSIEALKDFMDGNDTPRSRRLINQLKKIGYDAEEGLDGNENFFKDLGVARPEREKVNIEEAHDKESAPVRCPVCKQMVEKDELEDHMDEHVAAAKRPVKKMKKMEEGKKEDEKEENLGDEGLLPKEVAKKVKKKKDSDAGKYRRDYPVTEAKETSLDNRQKAELVDYMKDLRSSDKGISSCEEAAHAALEDVAGFESATKQVKAKVVKELVDLYKKKYGK